METEHLVDPYLARIGTDWIAYFSASEASRDSDAALFNPFGIVRELVQFCPLEAWHLLQFILAEDDAGRTLDLLSAGPLEDFISIHGEKWIDEIEEIAERDARFRRLLAGVWQLGTPDDVWNRVVAATGDADPFVSD